MKMKGNYRNGVIVAVIVLLVCFSVGAYSLSQYTLVDFSTPLTGFALVGLLSGMYLWKARMWVWLTGSAKFAPNYLCHSLCTCVLGLALFYIGNYALADDERGGERNAVVEAKYQKTRHKSRRAGRNRYVQGEAYSVYYMRVRFGDGYSKELQIEQKRYARLHKGDTVSLFVSEGLFRIPVVKFNRVARYTRGSSYRDQFKR